MTGAPAERRAFDDRVGERAEHDDDERLPRRVFQVGYN
jgi:hypothetical protein